MPSRQPKPQFQVGDEIEYSVSVELPGKWVRYGAKISVRQGETGDQATARLCGLVDAGLEALVADWSSE
jgi:hypothetical protein